MTNLLHQKSAFSLSKHAWGCSMFVVFSLTANSCRRGQLESCWLKMIPLMTSFLKTKKKKVLKKKKVHKTSKHVCYIFFSSAVCPHAVYVTNRFQLETSCRASALSKSDNKMQTLRIHVFLFRWNYFGNHESLLQLWSIVTNWTRTPHICHFFSITEKISHNSTGGECLILKWWIFDSLSLKDLWSLKVFRCHKGSIYSPAAERRGQFPFSFNCIISSKTLRMLSHA